MSHTNWNQERKSLVGSNQTNEKRVIHNPYLKPSQHTSSSPSSLLRMKKQHDNDSSQQSPANISNPYMNTSRRSNKGNNISSNNNNNQNEASTMSSSPSSSLDQLLFGVDSKFSMGNKTNPREFCNPYNKQMNQVSSRTDAVKSVEVADNPYKKTKISHFMVPTMAAKSETMSSSSSENIHHDTSIPMDFEHSLTETLLKNFGHASYRPGQLAIIHSLLKEKRDAAVFWSTGSGKSICYQIPPLHVGKIGLVISPLISLMEDQVAKLNGLVGSGGDDSDDRGKKRQVAVFLGSGQRDPMAQERALRGEYSLIYCTPEKLVSENGWFLDRLGELHHKNGKGDGICLIAVDESHCVSEWGHDFRREYRQIGSFLRNHRLLQNIPILALTATAVPRVQQDIMTSLQLNNPKVVKQSFDRENLILTIKRKPPGGYKAALLGFVKEMKEMRTNKRFRNESTIVYCPTQSLVEEITAWLEQKFQGSDVRVQSYHGGQSMDHRSDAHINFLTGNTLVIVATLAFGMGIDKTDIRQIIHYGPPKTMEEYYQQIGRAGRDGLESKCIMYCNSADFDQYKGDFYLGNLPLEMRSYQEMNIDALRQFAMSDDACRRAEILNFFNEKPSFGERCGTCDTCVTRATYSNDLERDFGETGARLTLYAISVLNNKQGISTIENLIKGRKIESSRYKNVNVNEEQIKAKVAEMKSRISGYKSRLPVSYFTKDLLPALIAKNFVRVLTQSMTMNGRNKKWSSYTLTPKGESALFGGPIILPVPASIREYENERKAMIKESVANLKQFGADVDQIPKHELEEGDGVVFKALNTWYKYLDLLQRNQRTDRLNELEDLRMRINGWRMDIAVKYRIAPSEVMPDHLLLSVAYAAASVRGGKTMEKESLISAGVRSRGIDNLVDILNEWIQETDGSPPPPSSSSSLMNATTSHNHHTTKSSTKNHSPMILPDTPFQPTKAWDFANYKPNKKTGLATWESSYNRFSRGEHPQSIAMSPDNGRPIQVNTVLGHVMDALLYGRPVNLKYLSSMLPAPPPNQSEWEQMLQCQVETGIDVTGNPKTSGKHGESVRITDFLEPIMGKEFTQKDFKDRTDQERTKFEKWCQHYKWFSTLRRIEFTPTFLQEQDQE